MFQYLYKYKCIHVYHQKEIKPFLPDLFIKAIFHCSRFARAGGATNFNHVKNQSPGHAKKVECSSTFMACPRAVRRTKNAQVRQLQRKLSNVRSARAGKATAMENGLNVVECTVDGRPLHRKNPTYCI